jgi:YebC/PmpR family DNA-binding regulatory protein
MSGHSKWSQIKRQKGAADVKRGAVFSKLTNAIIVAGKSGGDPNSNFTLKMAIEKAHQASMPKENIDRAIKRGTGELGGAKIEEVLYEAIGPQNIGILIEAATDNKNRTTSEVKNTLAKFGGKLVGSGAVSYQFNKMGKILIDSSAKDRDEIELLAIDAGAQDFDDHNEDLAVYTKPNELKIVKEHLESQGLTVKEAVQSFEPQATVGISDKSVSDKIIELMDALETLEDITNIYSNFDIKEDLIEDTGN